MNPYPPLAQEEPACRKLRLRSMRLRIALLSGLMLVVASCATLPADLAESEESADAATQVNQEIESAPDQDSGDPADSATTTTSENGTAPEDTRAGADEVGNGDDGDDGTGPDRSDTEKQPESVTQPDKETTVVGEVPHGMLLPVLEDAAAHAGAAADALLVVRAEAIEWPDGSLGCPEPGVVYTQAVVPGYWVELVSGDDRYDYRLTAEGDFVRCAGGGQPIGSPDA